MGSEVYAISQSGQRLAQKAQNALVGLGFKDRGVKDGSHLFVLKYTTAPAILIELFFVDSAADVALYAKLGARTIAEALAIALTS
jgi:N-acetylmuramoyl-L-alanine amidase